MSVPLITNSLSPNAIGRFVGPWADDIEKRIALGAACGDAADLPRVDGAGRLVEIDGRWFQVMHNGTLTLAGGYYADWTVDLIARCGGVHEPQEEKVFHEIVRRLKPGATMVELGCYWAYYSIWFARAVPQARVVPVEPIAHRRAVAEINLAANGINAPPLPLAIGDTTRRGVPFATGAETADHLDVVSVDDLLAERGLDRIAVLHADIQGFEYAMLRGAARTLSEHRADFILISTHRWLEEGKSLDLHATCRQFLTEHGYRIFAEHTPEESFTIDGLIAAHAPGVEAIPPIPLSRNGV